MRSKRITIVIGTIIILAFGYIVYTDAVRTWQSVLDQKNNIQNLENQYKQLNQKLDDSIDIKKQSEDEVKKLEKEKQELEVQRQKLESELQASKTGVFVDSEGVA